MFGKDFLNDTDYERKIEIKTSSKLVNLLFNTLSKHISKSRIKNSQFSKSSNQILKQRYKKESKNLKKIHR